MLAIEDHLIKFLLGERMIDVEVNRCLLSIVILMFRLLGVLVRLLIQISLRTLKVTTSVRFIMVVFVM